MNRRNGQSKPLTTTRTPYSRLLISSLNNDIYMSNRKGTNKGAEYYTAKYNKNPYNITLQPID